MPNKHNSVIVALLAIGLGVMVFFVWQTWGEIKKNPAGNPYAALTRPVFYAESPWEGNDGAKLQLFEFGDFACPACREMQAVVEKIFAKYGNHLTHIWKDFPLHPNISKPTAVAARCALRQEKFWPYHDWLFQEQANIKTLDLAAGAQKLGLDQAEFTACLSDKKVIDYVDRDFLEGQAIGVRETPAFVVGSSAFSGIISFEDFEQIVLQELAAMERQ